MNKDEKEIIENPLYVIKEEKEIIENPLYAIKEEKVEDQTKMEDNPICVSCLLCYFICLPLCTVFY